MIQEGPEDQGNPVKEFGRSGEVQEIQGGSGDPGRSVKYREVQKVFGGQVNFEMELLSGGVPHCVLKWVLHGHFLSVLEWI